jgi:bis(5'-nucleosidyl)-tetraphosphatase/histidine triad (HIT) family protein
MYDETCIFCREIVNKGNAAFIYRSSNILAFMDNAPIEEGHVLVIPRNHYENIYDIDNDIYLELQAIAKRIAIAVRDTLKTNGLNIGQNNGRVANQVVMHYHVHIIPRYYRKKTNWERETASIDDLEVIAAKIRAGIKEVKL